jgi:hypothetical protein
MDEARQVEVLQLANDWLRQPDLFCPARKCPYKAHKVTAGTKGRINLQLTKISGLSNVLVKLGVITDLLLNMLSRYQ